MFIMERSPLILDGVVIGVVTDFTPSSRESVEVYELPLKVVEFPWQSSGTAKIERILFFGRDGEETTDIDSWCNDWNLLKEEDVAETER
jgi:hypothetical protein